MQYVYWGNTSGVNVPCRTTSNDREATYDDNRHNPGASPTGDWFQSLTGLVNTSAAVSADGRTIYVATNNSDTNPTSGRLYFIDLDAQGYVSSVSTWGPAANGVTLPGTGPQWEHLRRGRQFPLLVPARPVAQVLLHPSEWHPGLDAGHRTRRHHIRLGL